MAAPTVPTLSSITTEGLRKAGFATPSATSLTRAQEEWMAEIKDDIFTRGKKLKVLQSTDVIITTEGLDTYSVPTDFSSDLSLSILDGASTGTAQDGAVGSITLASTDTVSEATLKQKKGILIYEGTGKNSYSQVTAYNSTTKIATVSPNFAVAPVAGDKYMFVDTVSPARQLPVFEYANSYMATNDAAGTPTKFYPIGDGDDGEYILYPKPYRASGVPWGLYLRYYVDLTRVDLAGTLMTTLYRRLRNVFVAGIAYKALANDDPTVAQAAAKYERLVSATVSAETYGTELSNLQVTLGGQ